MLGNRGSMRKGCFVLDNGFGFHEILPEDPALQLSAFMVKVDVAMISFWERNDL